MGEPLILPSFASGEISPQLLGRVDLSQYHSGLALIRNWFVDYRGGVSTRTGSQFVNTVDDSTNRVRLVPFEYSVTPPTVSFILEFGNFYLRVHTNGGTVLDTPTASIVSAPNLPIGTWTLDSSPFAVGDEVFVSGMLGLVELNNSYLKVGTIAGNVITLTNLDGSTLTTVSYGTYTGGGKLTKVYKNSNSPYASADLALIKFSQVGSVLTITHPNYPPYNLTYGGAGNNWTFTQIVFGTTLSPVTGAAAGTSGSGTTFFYYAITAVDSNGQESLISGGSVCSVEGVNIATTSGTNNLSWNPVSGAASYNIYKIGPSQISPLPSGAIYGYIGNTIGVGFLDTNLPPDFAITPPVIRTPFAANTNPGVSCYFQQRQTYAASNLNPQTFWMSQPGSFTNFNVSSPTQDSDAITGTLVSKQVNAIKSMLPMPGGLIALTAGGAWQISGGGATTPITPADAQGTAQAYNGASDIPPIVINEDILYVQSKGSIVRDLSYNIYVNIYTGKDITVLSNHLFFGYGLLEWAWAEEPFKIVWAVRSDGQLLSLTYIKDQQVLAWAHSDTFGLFESIASVTETVNGTNVNAVYAVVRRKVNGVWIRFIERFKERQFNYGAEDAWAIDCGSQTSANTPNTTLDATINGSTAQFVAGAIVNWNVGDVVRMGGGIATLTSVSALTATGTLKQAITNTIPNDPNNTPVQAQSSQWSYTTPFTKISGLNYLNGMTVTGLADGSVIPPRTVVNGQITLPNAATKAIIGLGFTAQLKTMPIDTGESPTSQGKRKKLSGLTMRVDNTRGLKYGRTLSTLVSVKERSPATFMGLPIPLISDDEFVNLDPMWDVRGQLYIQQDQPLPATVLALIPDLNVGDTSK